MIIIAVILLSVLIALTIICPVAQVIILLREEKRKPRIVMKKVATGLLIHVPGKGWVSADTYKE